MTVVEMTKWLAANSQISERMSLEEHMALNHVKTLTETVCTRITDKGVYVAGQDGKESFLEADTVIVSAGSRSLAAERDQFADTAFDVIKYRRLRQRGHHPHGYRIRMGRRGQTVANTSRAGETWNRPGAARVRRYHELSLNSPHMPLSCGFRCSFPPRRS